MQAALLAVVESGDSGGDQDGLAVAVDQAFGQQAGQVQGSAEARAPARGGGVAEKVGDGAGADLGGPVAADGGVVGVVAGVAVVLGQAGVDVRAGNGGGAQGDDLRCPRSWRGFHGDGRTVISTDGPGGCGGHAI